MESSLTPPSLPPPLLPLLLPLLLALSPPLQAANTSLHLQQVYPGCRSSPTAPDMSLPLCSRSLFLQTLGQVQSQTLTTSDLYPCFTAPDRNLTFNFTLGGTLTVAGAGTPPWNTLCRHTPCSCQLSVTGPPGSFFQFHFGNFSGKVEVWRRSVAVYEGGVRQEVGGETWSTSANSFSMEITVWGEAFTFSFQAEPECEKQLQVRCLSASSGLIETFGWSESSRPRALLSPSCVTLHLSGNDVMMISGVDVTFDASSMSADRQFCPGLVYPSPNCQGAPMRETCYASATAPELVNYTTALSIRHPGSAATGGRLLFRLLFSFHARHQAPRQYTEPGRAGQWDCGAPEYESFKLHFACHPDVYCSGQRPQAVCANEELCGRNMLHRGESCFQVYRPTSHLTWKGASGMCSKMGARLAVLREPSALNAVLPFLPTTVGTTGLLPVYLGLRAASDVTPLDLYQHTWFWADDTLAVFLPLEFRSVSPPYCAAATSGTLHMASCEEKLHAAFLCQTTRQSTLPQTTTTANISLSSRGSLFIGRYTRCAQSFYTHVFLECDVTSECKASNMEESVVCSQENGQNTEPFFPCHNAMQRVPFTSVCDFKEDCCDGSDEQFCQPPPCDQEGGAFFRCQDGKQCIPKSKRCNRQKDCLDGSDESKCSHTFTPADHKVSTVQPPAVVTFTGSGSFTVQPLAANTSCPPTHYQCPGGGYCLPVYTRCNGINDCPGKEDEQGCDRYTCPNFYRCRNSRICLDKQSLCDTVFHCPERDDELLCSFSCPFDCKCYGSSVKCYGFDMNKGGAFDRETRYLDVRHGRVQPKDLLPNTNLVHLRLQTCGISDLGQLNFPNLQILDLRDNSISFVNASVFSQVKNLQYLSLANNPLSLQDPFFWADVTVLNIKSLDLSGIRLEKWYDGFLARFSHLQDLNMSACGLTTMTWTGFQSLRSLRSLDIRGCPMRTFYPGVFGQMDELEVISADNYELCCPNVRPEQVEESSCRTPSDEISSCDALLRADVYRVFLALYACLSLVGNLGSFIYRIFIEKKAAKIGYEVFVTHLCVADFFMGVYLAIIGIADRIYVGNYRWKNQEWKESVACKTAGFLSLLSSEVSAFLICLITLERFLVIRFPHRNLRFSQGVAHAACAGVWGVGLALAVVPLLPVTLHWHFYSQTGICIPLPITRSDFPGKDYSFGVMIVMNFVLFLFIALGQILIYWSVRSNSIACVDPGRKARERTVARRLLAVVMTDFLCWFPIGLLGLLAEVDVPIPGLLNVAIAIFVLPFNSALNPFLYTLNALLEKRRSAAAADSKLRAEKEKRPESQSTVQEEIQLESSSGKSGEERGRRYSREEAFRLFKSFVEDGLLTQEQVRRRVWNIYEG